MDKLLLFLVVVLYVIVAYMAYTKMKMRNIIMELEYTVEGLHKRIEDYEGLHVEKRRERKRTE